MIKVDAYKSYSGGKSGSGTYQTLINLIPPHDIFYSLFLGNCGVTRHKKPALINVLTDLDSDVITEWNKVVFNNKLGVVWDISQRNAFDCLSGDGLFPGKKQFVFLDPPYLSDTRKNPQPLYRFEMGDKPRHVELLEAITNPQLSGLDIMICSYPNELYDLYLHGWNTVDFYSNTRNGLALERVYMNYEIHDGQLHDYSFIGDTFTERQQIQRKRNNIIDKLGVMDATLRNAMLSDIYAKYPPAV